MFVHNRDVHVLETTDDFHDAIIYIKLGLRQKLINQRNKLDALAYLRDLAINGFAASQRVVNPAQNFFQRGVTLAVSLIIRVAGVQSAQD